MTMVVLVVEKEPILEKQVLRAKPILHQLVVLVEQAEMVEMVEQVEITRKQGMMEYNPAVVVEEPVVLMTPREKEQQDG